jgi:hypothetical protein
MPGQEDIDIENEESLARQRASRDRISARRNIQRQERSLLSRAGSTRERRQIKEWADTSYQGAVYDLDISYQPSQNKEDYESDIQQRGTDQFTAPESTPQVPTIVTGGSDGGIPSGYVETSVTLCENGTAVTGKILFKEDP